VGQAQRKIANTQKRIDEVDAALESDPPVEEKLALESEKAVLERMLADYVKNFVDLSNLSAEESQPNTLSIIEPSHASMNPIRPRVRLYSLMGAVIGLVFALGLLFLWEYLDDTVQSTDELSQFKGLAFLGVIGKIKGRNRSEKVLVRLEPFSAVIEAFRMIRNKIQFGSDQKPMKSLVVTSPGAGEGKTITAANLAVILAQANRETILVDADFREPRLHEAFQASNEYGLGDLLTAAQPDIKAGLKDTGIDHLRILTSGKPLVNSSELFSSNRMNEILAYLEETADMVILDSPAALVAADAMILSHQADGVIVVIRAGKTKRKNIRQTLSDLEEAGAHVVGCVYNQIPRRTGTGAISGKPRDRKEQASGKVSGSKEKRPVDPGGVQPAAIRVKEKM
jgi:capsular exopolysaccharide synthesis family protein